MAFFWLILLIAVAVALTGCATSRRLPEPSAAIATRTAATATKRAVFTTTAARAAVIQAQAQIARAEETAPAEQKAVLAEASSNLSTATAALEETQAQLTIVTTAHEVAQKQIKEIGQQLAAATAAEENLKAARDFWRCVAWRLALLSLGLSIWTIRKPLFALCRIPLP